MLRTRLIVGTVLATLAAGMLLIDERFAPWFPFLFVTVAALCTLAVLEMLAMLPPELRPNTVVVLPAVLALIAIPWRKALQTTTLHGQFFQESSTALLVLFGFVAIVLIAFLYEMATYRANGNSVQRLALTTWIVAYLGLLPTFLVLLRMDRPNDSEAAHHLGTIALALAIFVPKACDIGAYFTGRAIGRHKMAPTLSPGKTWEGAIGGLALAVAVAFGINRLGPVIPGEWWRIAAFGLVVGAVGMLGDLAESMIKRDCERKDASQAVPGFGGILDVVDSILFAAPVVYWWLAI